MSAQQERLDQQAEIDAEVAASAARMRAHAAREQNEDVGGQVPAHPQVPAGEDARQQRPAVAEALREQFLDARERHLAVMERSRATRGQRCAP